MVDIVIEGEDPEAVNRCFQDLDFQVRSNTGSQFVVRATMKSQLELDALIDRLRSEKISVISLQQGKVSLEDAFLQIVDNESSRN